MTQLTENQISDVEAYLDDVEDYTVSRWEKNGIVRFYLKNQRYNNRKGDFYIQIAPTVNWGGANPAYLKHQMGLDVAGMVEEIRELLEE